MSKIQAIIILDKDKYTPATEDFQCHNFQCPHCYGKGGWNNEIGKDQYEWVECEKCKGAGKFSVDAHLKWIPDFN